MTSRDRRYQPQRGRGWYRSAFLILAVVPLALVVPLVVGSLLLGILALVTGVVVGVALISSFEGRRSSRKVTIGQSEADVMQDSAHVPDEEPTLASPLARSPRGGGHRTPADSCGGGCADVTRRPVALVTPSLPERIPPPDDHSAAGTGEGVGARAIDRRPTDPPVLEGGTAAGRRPWRLPAGQVQSGIAADAAQLGDLEVRAASVIGPGHRCDEPATARQDAYALMRARSGSHLIVAVADGVSSSASSEIGARVAVSAAARTLHQALEVSPDPERLAADTLFNEVAGEMVGTGRSRALDDSALCSLLIVAVIPAVAQPDGSRRVWTAQVGDVSLWLHGRNGWSQRTGRSKRGLNRNKVDAVLPFNPDQVVAGFVDVEPGQGVAVMTDGLGDTLSDVATAGPFFAACWARPPHLAGFVSDLCFDALGQNDDRTAVVVWCGQNTWQGEEPV